jgi:IclR family acetate operon transcriptional repressor
MPSRSSVSKPTLSLVAALRVIEQVSRDQPVGVSDLARTLGMPKSRAYRILETLRGEGWLRQDARGGWALSLRCATIGNRVGNETSLRAAARPALEELAAATHESVRLWLVEGESMAMLDSIESDQAVRPVVPDSGPRFPLHASAVGKAVLALWDENELQRYLSEPLRSMTPATITDQSVLREQIDRIRATGFAEARSEGFADIGGVAATVRVNSDQIAALSITYPMHRLLEFDHSDSRNAEADGDRAAYFGRIVAQAARGVERAVLGGR